MPRTAGKTGADAADGVTLALGCALPDGAAGLVLPGPEALEPGLLAGLKVRQVICPLVGRDFDALAVAERLALLGHAGPLVVLAGALPNPRMVEREIRKQGAGVEVQVVARAP